MLASELLKEFNDRVTTLEARTHGLQRIITSLEGLQIVFTNDTAGVSGGDADRFDRMIGDYLEQKEHALLEIDNLKAAYRDVDLAISRMAPEYQSVLSMRYVAGLSQYEIAKRLGVPRSTVNSKEAHALALLDYHLEQ